MCVPDLPANSVKGHQLRSTLSLTSIHHHFEAVDGGEKHNSVPGQRWSSDFDRGSRSPVVNMYDSLVSISENKDKTNELYDRLSPLPQSEKSSSSSPEPVLSPTGSLLQLGPAYTRKMHLAHHPHKYEYIDVDLEHSGESGSSDGVFSPSNMMEHPLTWMSPSSNDTPQPESNHKVSISSKKRVSIKETNSQPRKKQLPLQTTREESLDFVPSIVPIRASSEATRRKPSPAPRKSRSKTKDDALRPSSLTVAHQTSSSDESSFELIPDVIDQLRKDVVSPIHTQNGPTSSSIQHERTLQSPPPLPSRSGSDGDIPQKPKSMCPRPTSSIETPPLPPRPQHHKVPLPPVHIDIDKKPLPPKPKVLRVPDNATKKYVSLTFNNVDSVDFDDSNYSTVSVDQPVRIIPDQDQDERVSYSAVNFPVTDALHSTIRQRMTERAQS